MLFYFSAVAWQLTLSPPEKQKENGLGQGQPDDTNAHEGDICVLVFHSLISSDKAVLLHFLQFMTSFSFVFIVSLC